jgi:hypothetical protein
MACLNSAIRVARDITPMLHAFQPSGDTDVDEMLDKFVDSIPDNLRLLVSPNASVTANRPLPTAVQFKIGSLDYRVALENPGLSSEFIRRKYGAGTQSLAVHAVVAGQRLFLLDTGAFTREENATFHAGGVVALRYRSYSMPHEPALEGPLAFFCEALTPYATDAALAIEDELRRRLAAASIAPPAPSGSGDVRAAAAAGGKRKKGIAAASSGELGGASKRVISRALVPLHQAAVVATASATAGDVASAEAAVRHVLVANATTKRSLVYYNVTAQVERARAAGLDVPSHRMSRWHGRMGGRGALATNLLPQSVHAGLAVVASGSPPQLPAAGGGASDRNLSRAAQAGVAGGGVAVITALARIAGVTGPNAALGRDGLPALSASYVCTRDTVAAALQDMRYNQLFKGLFDSFGAAVLLATSALFAGEALLGAGLWLLQRCAASSIAVYAIAAVAWRSGNMRGRAPFWHVVRLSVAVGLPLAA